MKTRHALAFPALAILAGCAGMLPPPSEKLAALPVVTYPDKPAGGDYVYRLPAGKPIELHVRADGSALAAPAAQTVQANLARDIYLHQDWASEDGRTWVRADKLIGVELKIALPSYETPGPGDIHLTVERRAGQ